MLIFLILRMLTIIAVIFNEVQLLLWFIQEEGFDERSVMNAFLE